jgi:hypothetical protein
MPQKSREFLLFDPSQDMVVTHWSFCAEDYAIIYVLPARVACLRLPAKCCARDLGQSAPLLPPG